MNVNINVLNSGHNVREIRFDQNPEFCKYLEHSLGTIVNAVSEPMFIVDGETEPRPCRSVIVGEIPFEPLVDNNAISGSDETYKTLSNLLKDGFGEIIPSVIYGLAIVMHVVMDQETFAPKMKVVLRGNW